MIFYAGDNTTYIIVAIVIPCVIIPLSIFLRLRRRQIMRERYLAQGRDLERRQAAMAGTGAPQRELYQQQEYPPPQYPPPQYPPQYEQQQTSGTAPMETQRQEPAHVRDTQRGSWEPVHEARNAGTYTTGPEKQNTHTDNREVPANGGVFSPSAPQARPDQ